MVEKHSEPAPEKTLKEQASDVMDVVVWPLSAAVGAYVFNTKTSDALYDNLKATGKLTGISTHAATFKNSSYGAETANELGKFHKNWSAAYNEKLTEYGFSNVFKRFGGIHGNQKLEVIVQSVTAIGLVVGFSALLDQLKNSKKTETDKSLSL